jgi:hypothetical protein
MDLLRHHFMQVDIDAILQIKLHLRRMKEVLTWGPTANGIFTVKSAYWLGMDELHQPSIGAMISRAPNGRRAIWKEL